MQTDSRTDSGWLDRRARRAALAVFAAAFAIYLPKTVNRFGYTFDDGPYILQNTYLRSWSGAFGEFTRDQARIYRPMRSLALAAVTGVFGQNHSLPFHLVGMLFHAACSAATSLIVWFLVADPPAAAAAGLIFALHPVHADRAANIMGSFDLFGLALGYWAWALSLAAVRATPRRKGLAWGAAALMLAGCFASEEALMVLPLAALSIFLPDFRHFGDGANPAPTLSSNLVSKRKRKGMLGRGSSAAPSALAPSSGRNDHLRRLSATLCLAAPAIAYFAVRTHLLGGVARHAKYSAGSLLNTFWTMPIVIWRYIGLLFWPVGLRMAYGPTVHTHGDPVAVVALLGLLGLAIVALATARRAPAATMAIGWFFVGLAPFSNFLPNDALMAERFLYSGLGGFALAGGLLYAALRRRRKAASIVFAAILVLYGAGVVSRCRVWGDASHLWAEAATREPNSFLAVNQAAMEMMMDQRPREAERFARQANRLDGRRPEPLLNLAVIAFADRRRDDGMRWLDAAIRVAPWFCYGYDVLALRLGFDNDADGAAKAASASLRCHPPGDPSKSYVTAFLLVSAGRCDQAAPHIDAVLDTQPRAPEYSVTMALRERCRKKN